MTRLKKSMISVLAAFTAAAVMIVCGAVLVSADSIFDTAKEIDSGKKVSKTLGKNESMDYKITPSVKGTASVKITAKTNYIIVYVYDDEGNRITCENNVSMGRANSATDGRFEWDRTAETFKGTVSFDVKANNTYYIKLERGAYSSSGSGKIEASFNYPSEEKNVSALMSVTLKKGDSLQLGANGSSASWSSSDTSVAKVSSNGLVTAVKKGKAVITLKCGSKSQTIEIVVE